jgi:hypothetical protein
MALYILRSIFHLARLLYVRPETFGPILVSHKLHDFGEKKVIENKMCFDFLYNFCLKDELNEI